MTSGGKLFAIDSANGNIVWSKNLGRTTADGPELEVYDMWLVRETGDKPPTLAVVAINNGSTVGFHVNGLDGDVGDMENGLPKGRVIFDGRLSTAFILPQENCGTTNKVIAVVDQSSKVGTHDCRQLTSVTSIPEM